jgi:cation:H+ antiporter
MTILLSLIGGLALLVLGGELLVRGAVQAAARLGVSPLVIGLTVVGFGTSTPELVASVQAALSGSPGIAYGNVVGSNIANILLILGASALITPILVASNALKRDSSVMVAVAALFAALAAVTTLGTGVGLGFLAALAVYIYLAFRQERALGGADHGAAYDKSLATHGADPALAPERAATGPLWLPFAIAAAGLALVVGGGYFLVEGAVGLARSLGISETVIGLTIVAVGTSMPELVTSVMAALRRQTDVAFGNIVGSNIYNILGIAGATALMAPSAVPAEIVRFDNLVMLAASLLLVGFAATGRRISRWEGGVLVASYAAYVTWTWP